jgi:hypothetical protein
MLEIAPKSIPTQIATAPADDMDTDMSKVVPVFVNAATALDGAPVKVSKTVQEVLDGERV